MAYKIDSIPSTGRYIVLVHYYLHLSGAHISVFHNRLIMLKGAILKALKRNSNVVFAFRGPHVISTEWADNHSMCGDVQAQYFFKILFDLFKDIMDKVIFLDGWGMSMALDNEGLHPIEKMHEHIIRTLFSFLIKKSK